MMNTRKGVPELLPTSLVGSYAQPNWLIDRTRLGGRLPPRVRVEDLWRDPSPADNLRTLFGDHREALGVVSGKHGDVLFGLRDSAEVCCGQWGGEIGINHIGSVKPVRVGIGEWLEQYSVHGTEYRGARTDPDAERDERSAGECWCLSQAT